MQIERSYQEKHIDGAPLPTLIAFLQQLDTYRGKLDLGYYEQREFSATIAHIPGHPKGNIILTFWFDTDDKVMRHTIQIDPELNGI